jgi:hypothetical protein
LAGPLAQKKTKGAPARKRRRGLQLLAKHKEEAIRSANSIATDQRAFLGLQASFVKYNVAPHRAAARFSTPAQFACNRRADILAGLDPAIQGRSPDARLKAGHDARVHRDLVLIFKLGEGFVGRGE